MTRMYVVPLDVAVILHNCFFIVYVALSHLLSHTALYWLSVSSFAQNQPNHLTEV